MTLGCGFSKVGLAEVAKSDNEVVVQSNASVRPRSERFEMKPLDAIMVLIWIANRMWGIDDLVKKKFSRAVLQVESRDCVDPPRALWHAYSRLPCKGKPKDIGQFGLRWFDTALAMSGEQCAYRLSSITPSLEIRTTKANAGYGFNLRRGAFS